MAQQVMGAVGAGAAGAAGAGAAGAAAGAAAAADGDTSVKPEPSEEQQQRFVIPEPQPEDADIYKQEQEYLRQQQEAVANAAAAAAAARGVHRRKRSRSFWKQQAVPGKEGAAASDNHTDADWKVEVDEDAKREQRREICRQASILRWQRQRERQQVLQQQQAQGLDAAARSDQQQQPPVKRRKQQQQQQPHYSGTPAAADADADCAAVDGLLNGFAADFMLPTAATAAAVAPTAPVPVTLPLLPGASLLGDLKVLNSVLLAVADALQLPDELLLCLPRLLVATAAAPQGLVGGPSSPGGPVSDGATEIRNSTAEAGGDASSSGGLVREVVHAAVKAWYDDLSVAVAAKNKPAVLELVKQLGAEVLVA
jgi:hypothetical protein